MAHKDICIRHERAGRSYESVGFLEDGELEIPITEAIQRVANKNGGAIGEEGARFIDENGGLSPGPDVTRYWHATNWQGANKEHPDGFRYYYYHHPLWYHKTCPPDTMLLKDMLIIRSITPAK